MSCKICGAPYREGDGTTIAFSNKYDEYLNRTFTVCNKCAYNLLGKALELDPANERLNEPRTYDDVVKREG